MTYFASLLEPWQNEPFVSCCSDLSSIFRLTTNRDKCFFSFLSGIDTLTLHAKTPAFSSAPCALAFSPFASSSVVVVCADHTIAVVDAENGLPTEWTKKASALPQQWLSRKEKVVGVSFDPGAPTTAYLHDHSGFCVVDFAKPIPSPKARWVSIASVTRRCVGCWCFSFFFLSRIARRASLCI